MHPVAPALLFLTLAAGVVALIAPALLAVGYIVGFRASAVADAAQRLFVERMRRVFDSLHSEASDAAIVVKEPRLSLTWPFWRPLIAPRRSVCVVLYRHPFLVAAGLRWRPRNRAMQLDDWLALWEKYTVGTLRACDGMRKVLVSHDALARSPQAPTPKARTSG